VDKNHSLLKIRKEIETITSLGYQEMASFFPKDNNVFGFFCPYVPEELLHAAGALPFRLMGTPIKISNVQAYLPPNCCHLVKSSLESLVQGELDFLKGIVFSHTCDAMQGLSDIWSFQKRLPLHFNFMMPSHLDSELARPYLKAEIVRFKTFLETHLGEIHPQRIKASIELFNRIREKVGKIYARRRCSDELTGSYFAQIIRAEGLMDRQRYLELLSDLLDNLPEKKEGYEELVPIFLVGNMTHSAFYFSLIEEAGARVIYDDLCSGARFLHLRVSEDTDPIEALMERYFKSFLCPTKYKGAYAHGETLLKVVKESGAKGIIFLFYKYCETHFFDYPDLKSALESEGIPTLLLEVEDPSYSQEQLKIRIQAFVEMLGPI
jgi:benzoyl-CoA reductase/2-hydroxyglutaryl-CoA dehydratase subunit BcrC/BadD/HgdB